MGNALNATQPARSPARPRLRRGAALCATVLAATLISGAAVAQPTAAEPSAAAPAERPLRTVVASLGIGLPALVHAELGGFLTPRLLVELHAGTYVFNLLTGLRAEMHLLGEGAQPRHALTVGVGGFVNPLMSPSEWTDPGAESIGVGGEVLVGWRLLTDGGFLLRARAGALVYAGPSGLEGGPSFLLSAGWAL